MDIILKYPVVYHMQSIYKFVNYLEPHFPFIDDKALQILFKFFYWSGSFCNDFLDSVMSYRFDII